MWKAYLKVIKKKLPHTLDILDRYHIVANLNKAVDEVRRREAKQMKALGYENVLAKSKYCFLKNPEKSGGGTECEAQRNLSVRFEERQGISAKGKLSAFLGISFTVSGVEILCPSGKCAHSDFIPV